MPIGNPKLQIPNPNKIPIKTSQTMNSKKDCTTGNHVEKKVPEKSSGGASRHCQHLPLPSEGERAGERGPLIARFEPQ